MKRMMLAGLIMAAGLAQAADPFRIDIEALKSQMEARAHAQEAFRQWPQRDETTLPNGTRVPRYETGIELIGRPGQSTWMLLVEQGQAMREATLKTGWEVCARVCISTSRQVGLRVTTVRSGLYCAVAWDQCPEGFLPTDALVHTHPADTMSRVEPADRSLFPQDEFILIGNPNTFSPEDRMAGEGWLLTPDGQVLHHEG